MENYRRLSDVQRKEFRNKFAQYIDARQKTLVDKEIMLNQLKQICWQFDGKVLNKRFSEAFKELSDWWLTFDEYHLRLGNAQRDERDEYYSLYICYQKRINYKAWEWKKGDRMEADKAVEVIDDYLSENSKQIEELPSLVGFDAYIKKTEKLCQLIDELSAVVYPLSVFVRDKMDIIPYMGYIKK